MKTIPRQWALRLLAMIEVLATAETDLTNILASEYYDEQGISIPVDRLDAPEVTAFLVELFMTGYAGVQNDYLLHVLNKVGITGCKIDGTPAVLQACPSCRYATLHELGEHEICTVCGWEDDGRDDDSIDEWSHTNRMTLANARTNFTKVGACSPQSVPHVDPNGKAKFEFMG